MEASSGARQSTRGVVRSRDVDSERRVLHVARQIKMVRGKPIFAFPKGGEIREVPLPDSVIRRLEAHAEQFPPIPITLPWGSSTGKPRTVMLYLYTADLQTVKRSGFNQTAWRSALAATGIEDSRRNGMHVLRHTYASVLLDAGESVKALAAYLGHADPGLTLRTYTHLLPTSEDRTRRAIDRAFTDGPDERAGLETA
ncbi:tyrosine-type recombinase/integrase [Planosporangium sp. 12N6]|uniref:tyrosine-type recombinase/integrase n=1 Tax=Planosporangium spinosum TaxID=3402278 RepID=UPI003CEA61AF